MLTDCFNMQAQPLHKWKLPKNSACYFVNEKKPRDENVTGSSGKTAQIHDHHKNLKQI